MNLQDEKEVFRLAHRVGELESRLSKLEEQTVGSAIWRALKTFLLREEWIDAREYVE